MTMREIQTTSSKIHNEIKNNKQFEASMHGKKIEFPNVDINNESPGKRVDLTDAQRKSLDDDKKRFFERK